MCCVEMRREIGGGGGSRVGPFPLWGFSIKFPKIDTKINYAVYQQKQSPIHLFLKLNLIQNPFL